MKVSYNWLREFLPFDFTPEETAETLTQLGLAVDEVVKVGPRWEGKVVVGEIVECRLIDGSDHLKACRVFTEKGRLYTIVCGAPNVTTGIKVPLALTGAKLADGLVVSPRKIKEINSEGVIPSPKELGLSEDHSGIIILPSDLGLGFDLREIVKEDWILEVDVTFNRPDCLSHLGIARELAAKWDINLHLPAVDDLLKEILTTDDPKFSEDWVVRIESPEVCPRYTARLVTEVKVGPSPWEIQQRLMWLGLRPINNVVDATNYVLLGWGHPLHAFDADTIRGKIIRVRRAFYGETLVTLDGKERELRGEDLLIADKERGLAMAGIMGGEESEIKDKTQNVLIEAAYFDPTTIWTTARFHNLSTDSSRRFERGTDPEMTLYANSLAAYFMAKWAKGKVSPGFIDQYPNPRQPVKVPIRWERLVKILGSEVPYEEGISILQRLGCQIETHTSEPSRVMVSLPSWRKDLFQEEDLIEEVARIYGYDKIPARLVSQLPLLSRKPVQRRYLRTLDVKRVMVEEGFQETQSWSMISPWEGKLFCSEKELIKISNPISEDLSILRPSLMPGLMRAIRRNLSVGIDNIRLFEWGKVYRLSEKAEGSIEGDEVKIDEKWMLAGVMVGNDRPSSWMDKGRSLTIWDLKGVIERIRMRLHIDKGQWNYYIENEGLEEVVMGRDGNNEKEKFWGRGGRVKKSWAEKWDIDREVWFFEMDGETLLSGLTTRSQFRSLPRFPAVERDLAFVVDNDVLNISLEEMIWDKGKGWVEKVELFDLYTGPNLPSGKKSMAYHLVFRSPERTLTDDEVDELIKMIVNAVKEKLGGTLRGTQ